MSKSILIYANNKPESQSIKKELTRLCQSAGLTIVQAGQIPYYIITIGGDGTLLSAFHKYKQFLNDSRFIAIHTGHLGFYTDWRPHEIELLVQELRDNDGDSIDYPLIEARLHLTNGETIEFLALNEISIRSGYGAAVIDVYISDYFFETFRGDGICISTPTGSTGLNKSLGGAITHPRVKALQLTEMAGINNRVYRTIKSPMIIPSDEWFELRIKSERPLGSIQIDHEYYQDIQIQSLHARIATESIRFARFRHTHFWDRVENAFLGRKKHFAITELSERQDEV